MSRHGELLRAIANLSDEQKRQIWEKLSPADVRAFTYAWDWQAHEGQKAPEGPWRVWLLLAGRGFGKTRAGSEWVIEMARRYPRCRIALIGATIEETVRVMIDGESGIRSCAPPDEAPAWFSSRHELRFPSGAVAHAYSGASGEALRGPQHHFAWADELGKWSDPERAWMNLEMGMRLGSRPRILVTTPPGNTSLLKRIREAPGTVVRGGRTADNRFLPKAFIEAIESAYRGTRLGRQELDGEILDEAQGTLWPRDLIERCRVAGVAEEELARVVVGVDPPATAGGDACGIIVCALGRDGSGRVLADASIAGELPGGWARRVALAAEAWRADRVVAEVNNGGDMVAAVLRSVDPGLSVKTVRASRGKAARAEPVAALFEAGKCGLAGHFPELEDEMSAMTVGGYSGAGSPDRADAMVWALTELMLDRQGEPRLRTA